ncbi:MAG: hypothetical protein JWQ09_4394, partial [Segetibacter sp.]|nr:hypothetical protein [Segetibacter sp.]
MTHRDSLEIEIIGQLVCFNASFTKVGGIL